jgi:hypothetical protein
MRTLLVEVPFVSKRASLFVALEIQVPFSDIHRQSGHPSGFGTGRRFC